VSAATAVARAAAAAAATVGANTKEEKTIEATEKPYTQPSHVQNKDKRKTERLKEETGKN
jgi:hypothetical protein